MDRQQLKQSEAHFRNKPQESMSPHTVSNAQFTSNSDAKITTNDKQIHKVASHPHQITYKIKDGLYLATSLDAFKDDQFVLLNWIQHIVVLENDRYPFDNRLKSMYGQEHDEIVEDGQEVIRYLHFDESLFINHNLQAQAKEEQVSDLKMDQSLIRQLHKPSNQNRLVSRFSTIYHFIEQSHQFGSSCLIIPSSPSEDIDDLSCIFSICTAYLMRKYKWSLYKALQFMNSRLNDVNLSQLTYEWLNKVQIQLLEQYTLTYNWESYQSTDELVLRNTFLNAKKILCDNSLRKLEINGQMSSRQRLKSKSKYQNPLKKPILTNRTYQNYQNNINSILKQPGSLLTLRSQRKKLQINTSLNQIKQYEINPLQQDERQENSYLQGKNQNQTDKSFFDTSNSSSFLSASRNKRISLCVSKIVSKYREQQNLSQRNKSKTNNFEKATEIKGMTKKKSFYNFESCKSLANQTNKDLRSNESQQISKILKKIKIKNNMDSANEEKNIQTISFTQPSICNFAQNQPQNLKLKTQSGQEVIKTAKRGPKNQQKNEIVRRNSLNTKQSTNQSSNTSNIKSTQPNTYKSQQKLRQLKPQANMKSQSIIKTDQRGQNSIDKLNGTKKVYIKEIKTQKSFDKRQLLKENIENAQKPKEKTLMIDYEDFKEMIQKKQKSIGNLVNNHVIDDRTLREKPTNGLFSVIEKLKKDVSDIQLSMNQSNILKRPQQNSHKKTTNSKTATLKWR